MVPAKRAVQIFARRIAVAEGLRLSGGRHVRGPGGDGGPVGRRLRFVAGTCVGQCGVDQPTVGAGSVRAGTACPGRRSLGHPASTARGACICLGSLQAAAIAKLDARCGPFRLHALCGVHRRSLALGPDGLLDDEDRPGNDRRHSAGWWLAVLAFAGGAGNRRPHPRSLLRTARCSLCPAS